MRRQELGFICIHLRTDYKAHSCKTWKELVLPIKTSKISQDFWYVDSSSTLSDDLPSWQLSSHVKSSGLASNICLRFDLDFLDASSGQPFGAMSILRSCSARSHVAHSFLAIEFCTHSFFWRRGTVSCLFDRQRSLWNQASLVLGISSFLILVDSLHSTIYPSLATLSVVLPITGVQHWSACVGFLME